MKVYLLLLVLLFSSKAISQDVKIYMDNVRVESIDNGKEDSEVLTISNHEDGPFIEVQIVIANESSEIIEINPSIANYLLYYIYEGTTYKRELFPLAFMDKNKVNIFPGKKAIFTVTDHLFYGTPIYSVGKSDYTREIIICLPTVKFIYQQTGLTFTTSEINSVVISD